MGEVLGRHTRHMGAVEALKALAEIPPERRSPDVRRTLADSTGHPLRRHLHRRSHESTPDSRPGRRGFGFPLMYQTDVLEILGILTGLGVREARMDEALAPIAAKQDGRGRGKLENTFS